VGSRSPIHLRAVLDRGLLNAPAHRGGRLEEHGIDAGVAPARIFVGGSGGQLRPSKRSVRGCICGLAATHASRAWADDGLDDEFPQPSRCAGGLGWRTETNSERKSSRLGEEAWLRYRARRRAWMRLRAFGATIAGLSGPKGGVARRRMIGIAAQYGNPPTRVPPLLERESRWPRRLDASLFASGWHSRARNDNPASRPWFLQMPRSNDTACRAAAERHTRWSWDGCGHAPDGPDLRQEVTRALCVSGCQWRKATFIKNRGHGRDPFIQDLTARDRFRRLQGSRSRSAAAACCSCKPIRATRRWYPAWCEGWEEEGT